MLQVTIGNKETDSLDAVVQVIQALGSWAWPVAVVVIALIFRQPLTEAIKHGIKLKAGLDGATLETTTEQKVEKVEDGALKVAVAEPSSPPSPPLATDSGIPSPQTEESPPINAYEGVVISWIRFETALRHLCEIYKIFDKSPMVQLSKLRKIEVLSNAEIQVAQSARRIRNDFIHGSLNPPMNENQATRFVESVDTLTRRLEEIIAQTARQ